MEEMRDGKCRRISNKTNVLYIRLVIFCFILFYFFFFFFLVFLFLPVQHSLKRSLGCQANVQSAINVRSGVLGFGYVVRMSGKRAGNSDDETCTIRTIKKDSNVQNTLAYWTLQSKNSRRNKSEITFI